MLVSTMTDRAKGNVPRKAQRGFGSSLMQILKIIMSSRSKAPKRAPLNRSLVQYHAFMNTSHHHMLQLFLEGAQERKAQTRNTTLGRELGNSFLLKSQFSDCAPM